MRKHYLLVKVKMTTQGNMAKNSKFFPSKLPKLPKGRGAIIKNSFWEVDSIILNQFENMFLTREAKNNIKEEIVPNHMEEMKDEDQIRDKIDVDLPKDKGDEESVEGKKGKGKKRKKKKKRKNRRVLSLDEGSGRAVDALEKGAGCKENEARTKPAKTIRREKHQDADLRRYENLAQRRDAARACERKRSAPDKYLQVIAERNRELQSRCKSKLRTHSPGLSSEPHKGLSAESSLGSIYGPSLYSDNGVDRDDLSVDIPIF